MPSKPAAAAASSFSGNVPDKDTVAMLLGRRRGLGELMCKR
jgi:hypothetical protein